MTMREGFSQDGAFMQVTTPFGSDVLLLDAGDKFDRASFWTHVQPWEARERRALADEEQRRVKTQRERCERVNNATSPG